jgi:hypothetical protein
MPQPPQLPGLDVRSTHDPLHSVKRPLQEEASPVLPESVAPESTPLPLELLELVLPLLELLLELAPELLPELVLEPVLELPLLVLELTPLELLPELADVIAPLLPLPLELPIDASPPASVLEGPKVTLALPPHDASQTAASSPALCARM